MKSGTILRPLRCRRVEKQTRTTESRVFLEVLQNSTSQILPVISCVCVCVRLSVFVRA